MLSSRSKFCWRLQNFAQERQSDRAFVLQRVAVYGHQQGGQAAHVARRPQAKVGQGLGRGVLGPPEAAQEAAIRANPEATNDPVLIAGLKLL